MIFKLSPDASILCYGVDFSGNERYELRFKNIETKEDFGPSDVHPQKNFLN